MPFALLVLLPTLFLDGSAMFSIQASADRRQPAFHRFLPVLIFAVAFGGLSQPARGTWSIVVVDTKTREVAVGAATCLTNFDLEAGLPMMLLDVGGAAAQSLIDSGAVNRMLIREQMLLGRDPAHIISVISQSDPQFQSRQFGIVDTRGRSAAFTGLAAGQYRGNLTGKTGNLVYAIQGNVLTGSPVLTMAEQALVNTLGDLPKKLMAAMNAARSMGGDGRCSCSPTLPDVCGSPPPAFEKSAHIGFMIVTRTGDSDGTCNGTSGCANGHYFMNFNVSFQDPAATDPVLQLYHAYNAWHAANLFRPDAVHSTTTVDPPTVMADATHDATITFQIRDWADVTVNATLSVVVGHDPSSAGASQIGAVESLGGGAYRVPLTVPPQAGLDVFRITVDDSVRPVVLLPLPTLRILALSDADRDGDVDLGEYGAMAAGLAGPGVSVPPANESADTDHDGDVDLADVRRLQLDFTATPCSGLFIDTHPLSQLVPCGRSFTLSVGVDADPPAMFQWFHDGLPVPGATASTYFVAVATSADLGAYFVHVTNSCGALDSNTAILTPRGSCP